LYLDAGYDACDRFIQKYLLPRLPEIIRKKLYKDAKSHFQEEAQEKEGVTPAYKVLKEWGPDHKKKFTVGVYLGSSKIAEGEGYSKQEAEEEAAKAALEVKKWNQ
ncbi:MAG: putative dsRNA-binding protein, partial [Candidatus Saccharimonadales bacterium]